MSEVKVMAHPQQPGRRIRLLPEMQTDCLVGFCVLCGHPYLGRSDAAMAGAVRDHVHGSAEHHLRERGLLPPAAFS